MAREVMVWNTPTVKMATSEAALDTAPALECQVTAAVLTPQPVYNTIPATGCAGATQSPGTTGWTLELAWLQDWTAAAASSLSWFAWNNDGKPVWVELVPDGTDVTPITLTGQFFATAGGFGATFGDGSAAATTASWPAVDKPDITPGTTTTTAAADAELADTPA